MGQGGMQSLSNACHPLLQRERSDITTLTMLDRNHPDTIICLCHHSKKDSLCNQSSRLTTPSEQKVTRRRVLIYLTLYGSEVARLFGLLLSSVEHARFAE